jgi:hypothetical protein
LTSTQDIGSDIVFSRDVIHHQENPCGFLSDLYSVASKYLILRLRTRESGTTNFNAAQSCQYVHGHWVPYIVFNTAELADLIRSFKPAPARILLWRHPAVLGGFGSRFLPKELYEPETGTAETALLVKKGLAEAINETVVSIETRPETRSRYDPYWVRLLMLMARRLGI